MFTLPRERKNEKKVLKKAGYEAHLEGYVSILYMRQLMFSFLSHF